MLILVASNELWGSIDGSKNLHFDLGLSAILLVE